MNAGKLENHGVLWSLFRVSCESTESTRSKALLLGPSASPLPPESVGSEARPQRETLNGSGPTKMQAVTNQQ